MSHQILLAKNTKLSEIISFANETNLKNNENTWLNVKTGERFSEYLLLKNGSRVFEANSQNINIEGMINYFKNRAISEYKKMPDLFHKKYTEEQYIQLIINCDLIPAYFFENGILTETISLNEEDRLSFFINFFCNSSDYISVYDIY